MIDEVKQFMASDERLTVFTMSKQIRKIDSGFSTALSFMYWQKFCWDTEDQVDCLSPAANGISKPVPYIAELACL